MRALAHPARLALLEHLRHSGPATATQCAEVVDLSPSAVSYHLRALARAGFVAEAPGRGDGRERMWRATATRYELQAPQSPAEREAMRALVESLVALDQSRVREYLDRLPEEPADWQRAAFFADVTLLVTADELVALNQALTELLAPYRSDSRPDAPAGARTVRAVLRALPS